MVAKGRRNARFLLAAGGALAVCLALLLGALWTTPGFYSAELNRAGPAQQAACDRLLANVSATSSETQRVGEWRTEFTAEEINGWLAVDLPRNHASVLGEEVDSPRIALGDQRGTIAFRHRGVVSTVISLDFLLAVHDDRTIAVHFLRLSAGAVPLPLSRVIEHVSAAAAAGGVQVNWTEVEGRPVALVSLPASDTGDTMTLFDSVVLAPGRLAVSGRTATTPVWPASADAK